jgi:riboflavin synthase
MFTGLIQDVGKIQSIEPLRGGVRLTIATQLELGSVKIGDSISVDGVCLTVVKWERNSFTVEVSPETLQRTTLLEAKQGRPVNLEMALRMSDPLGGHLVSGHVDGTGEIVEVIPEGNSWRYRFRVPAEISRYLVGKGSVAVDGISLTVADCKGREFSVSVIPHTAQATTLGRKQAGDRVNLENDIIAKYVEKFLGPREDSGGQAGKMDAAFLAQHGFIKSRE